MPGITATASPTRLDAVVLIRRTDGFVLQAFSFVGFRQKARLEAQSFPLNIKLADRPPPSEKSQSFWAQYEQIIVLSCNYGVLTFS